MRQLTDRLLTGSPWWRLTLYAVLLIFIALCFWLCLLVPCYQQQQALTEDYAQLRRQQQQLQRQLRQFIPPVPFAAPLAQPAPLPVTEIAQTQGITLISWLPQHRQGAATSPAFSELVLLSDWQQLPALFDVLARHQAFPGSFSVTPAEQQLKLTLYLETGHESGSVIVTD